MRAYELLESNHSSHQITQQDLDTLETELDKLYSVLGLDVEFTRHFLDRVNDARNKRQISIEELYKLFKEELKVYGKKIAQAGPDFEAVMNDMSTALNVPFILKWNKQKEELDLIAKTVMRKDPFMSSDPKLVVGLTSKKRN
ncbi:MAG: hypothetical protein HC836_25740 [Richelia sp. RM2_1_2]|nr:hypothetical protein [Richelia sp. RM2_1_2]